MKYIKKYEGSSSRRGVYRVDFPKKLIDFSKQVANFMEQNLDGVISSAEVLSQYISVEIEVFDIEDGFPFTILSFYYDMGGMNQPASGQPYNQKLLCSTNFQSIQSLKLLTDKIYFLSMYNYLNKIIPDNFKLKDIPEIEKHLNNEEFEFWSSIEKYNL